MTYAEIARQLRGTAAEAVLLQAAKHGGEGGNGAPDERAAYDGRQHLRRLGLLVDEESLAGEVDLNTDGHAVAAYILRSRESGEERLDAVTRAVADAALTTRGLGWRISDAAGRAVTEEELDTAVTRLERWRCAKPQRRAAGGFSRLSPLDLMSEIPRIDGLLIDYFDPRAASHVDHSVTNTTNISGGTVGGVQTGGGGNTQHVSQTISSTEQAEMLAALGQVLAALEAEPNDRLRADVEAIRGEVVSERPEKPRVREKVQAALITAGVTGASNLVFQGLAQMLGMTAS